MSPRLSLDTTPPIKRQNTPKLMHSIRNKPVHSPRHCSSPVPLSRVISVCTSDIEAKIKDAVCNSWRRINRLCKQYDVNGDGSLDASEFLHVLQEVVPDINPEDASRLFRKYDVTQSGRVPYREFLRYFVLRCVFFLFLARSVLLIIGGAIIVK